MEKTWEIERIFNQDIREKKRAGSGAFHMRGKGIRNGSRKPLRTQSYFMKGKEKRQLNGEVETYNMYETILTKEEFDLKEQETQRQMMIRWRNLYSNEKIKKDMGFGSNASYYKMVNGLDLPKKSRGGNTAQARKAKAEKRKQEQSIAIVESGQAVQEIETPKQEPQKLITKGLFLEYNGNYDADQINKILTKLQLLVEGEESNFSLSISLQER